MYKDTGAIDAASNLFNLDDYVVLGTEGSGASRTVHVEPRTSEAPCPRRGVFSRCIKARPVHRVKDVACGGKGLEVMVRKRRLVCKETAGHRSDLVAFPTDHQAGRGNCRGCHPGTA